MTFFLQAQTSEFHNDLVARKKDVVCILLSDRALFEQSYHISDFSNSLDMCQHGPAALSNEVTMQFQSVAPF